MVGPLETLSQLTKLPACVFGINLQVDVTYMTRKFMVKHINYLNNSNLKIRKT